MEQKARWIKITDEVPQEDGNSQWFAHERTIHSWQGVLPDEWLRLES